jgi:EAL domain-containing protein (putative c-di-GMP-specific phosphodiesterase class I)
LPDLALGITESVIMEQRLPALDIMEALMNLGVALSIDSFGTG